MSQQQWGGNLNWGQSTWWRPTNTASPTRRGPDPDTRPDRPFQ